MARRTFLSREIISALTDFGYVPQSHRGSHVRLRYENADAGDVRNVDVPLHSEIRIGTLHSIADQCGAEEFQAWCDSDYCESVRP